MTHELKVWLKFFQVAWEGIKTFEIRLNDRGYHVGDGIVFQEWDHELGIYTGREIDAVITYLTDFRQRQHYVVFAFEITGRRS